VISLGASHIKDGLDPQYVDGVKLAYNDAVAVAFYAGIAFAAVSAFISLGMEWKSVKQQKDGNAKKLEVAEVDQRTNESLHELPEIRRVSEAVTTESEEKK